MSKYLKKVPSLKNPNLSVPKPNKILDNIVTVFVFTALVLFVFLATVGISWAITTAINGRSAPKVYNDTTVIANIDGDTRQFNRNIDIKYRDGEVLFTQNKKTYTVPNTGIVIIEPAGTRYTDMYPNTKSQKVVIRINESDTITADIYEILDDPNCKESPDKILRAQDKLYKVSPDIIEFVEDRV